MTRLDSDRLDLLLVIKFLISQISRSYQPGLGIRLEKSLASVRRTESMTLTFFWLGIIKKTTCLYSPHTSRTREDEKA
jgi:hypothetical protein